MIPTESQQHQRTTEPGLLSDRLRRRDAEALENIYLEFHRYVMATAVRTLGSEWEAEEVVQDVFLALWQRPPELLHGMTSLVTWLAVTTRRQCWLRLRRAERQPECEQLPENSDFGQSDPTLDRIAHDQRRRNFEAVLPQITPKHRKILTLVYYENMEPTEVATRLEMPVVTVRKSLASATVRLRRRLAAFARDECRSLRRL